MSQIIKSRSLIVYMFLFCLFAGCSGEGNNIQRFGQLRLVEPSEIEHFEGMREAISIKVLDELSKANIRNYSLFLKDLGDSAISVFCYFEYTGADFHAEMSALRKNPIIQQWERGSEETPIRGILPGSENDQWKNMEEVFNYEGSSTLPGDVGIQPYGMVIGLRPEFIDSYKLLHQYAWPEVLDAIDKGNIRNYSIYLHEIEGNHYLFSYFEYTGINFDADMSLIDSDPATIAWMKFTDRVCQLPIPTRSEGEWWARMKELLNTPD